MMETPVNRLPLIALVAAASLGIGGLAACSDKTTTTAEASATPTAAATPAEAKIDTKSATFVADAAATDMYEVESAKLALTNSKAKNIKDFAQQMIDAHTATTAALVPLATAASITPPTALPGKYTSMLDDLRNAKPADFDKKYLDQATSVHNDALGLMKDYADHGENPGIKAFAAETAPKVQMHLDMAKGLDKSGADDPKKNQQPT